MSLRLGFSSHPETKQKSLPPGGWDSFLILWASSILTPQHSFGYFPGFSRWIFSLLSIDRGKSHCPFWYQVDVRANAGGSG